jgi:hypothetical protein
MIATRRVIIGNQSKNAEELCSSGDIDRIIAHNIFHKKYLRSGE